MSLAAFLLVWSQTHCCLPVSYVEYFQIHFILSEVKKFILEYALLQSQKSLLFFDIKLLEYHSSTLIYEAVN